MKSSSFGRAFELARMAAQIGIKEARSGNLASRMEQALILAEGLSKLKGAAMKAGQLLSLELNDYFPKEAAEILSRLQNSGETIQFDVIEKVIRSELGDAKFAEIEKLNRTPVGSASIGQVHRAQYDGRDMVLKVQYPGVAESIDADLQILKTVAKAFCALSGREMDLGPLFTEFRQILAQEVNYQKEAELQMRYRELAVSLDDVPGLKYVVPRIEPALSTKKIIGMDWEEGLAMRPWIATRAPQQQRETIAKAVLNLYFHEFFEWGLVQTDPNLANFLVRQKNEGLELVLLDFGATREFPREFIRSYVKLLEATASGDRDILRAQAISFGLIDPRESDKAFEALYQVLRVAVRPFFAEDGRLLDHSPFDFSDQNHAQLSQSTTKELAAELKYSPPPHGLVFLHRKLGGVYAILKSLGVKIDVSVYWHKMMERNL